MILLATSGLPGRIKAAAEASDACGRKALGLQAPVLANGDLGSIILFGSFLAWGRLVPDRAEARGIPTADPNAGNNPNAMRNNILGRDRHRVDGRLGARPA